MHPQGTADTGLLAALEARGDEVRHAQAVAVTDADYWQVDAAWTALVADSHAAALAALADLREVTR